MDTAVHEILHRDAHPQANAALRTLALAGDDLGEGITELLTFRAVGPEDYRRLPNGYRRYAAAVGEDTVFLPYRAVTMAAEKIAADVGEVEVYRAFFENDPESLAAVLTSARRHGFTDAPEGDVRLGERPIGSGQPDESPGEDDGIRRRAYYLWEVAGRPETPQDYPEGRSDFFWLQAEREASHLRPRIIQRAYQLWSRAGRPEGQRDVHSNRAQAQILNLLPEVEARANQLWLEAGRPEGQAEAHWQAAEDFVYAPQGSYLDPTPSHIEDLAEIRPTSTAIGPWAGRVDKFLDRLVDRAARNARPVREIYEQLLGSAAHYPEAPSPFARHLVQNVRHLRGLFSSVHDIHAHPEGYDARLGYTYANLIRKAGRYAEVFVCGIPQACGVGHYTNLNSPPPSYEKARELDARHLADQIGLRSAYGDWATNLEKVAVRFGPELARRLDDAAFNGHPEIVAEIVNGMDDGAINWISDENHLPIGPMKAARWRHRMITLAVGDPHLALQAHLSITGFNPAKTDSAGYLLDMLVRHYYEITGAGETTLLKENITQQMRLSGDAFDFGNREHLRAAAQWLSVQQAMGKITLIHSDWAELGPRHWGLDGRLRPTSKHGYNRFDEIIDLVAPFAQDPGSSIVLAHTGIGRYVKPSTKMRRTPVWLADKGYGSRIPMHILKMEEAVRRAPGIKFDISWNDVGIEFVRNPDLRAGLLRFIELHPGAIYFGSDTVKPVNRSQYLQNLTTLTDFLVELGANNPDLVVRVLRTNFEALANRAFSKNMDREGLNAIAADLDSQASDIRDPQAGSPLHRLTELLGSEETGLAADELSRLAGEVRDTPAKTVEALSAARRQHMLITEGMDFPAMGNTPAMQVVRGRNDLRQVGEDHLRSTEFARIDQLPRAELERLVLRMIDPDDLPDLEPRRFTEGRPGQPDPTDSVQGGTPWGWRSDEEGQQHANRMAFVDRAATTAAGFAGFIPGAAPVAGLIRAALFTRGLGEAEFYRRAWESVFEDGRPDALGIVTEHVVRVGREIGTPKERLATFVSHMARMETDYRYIAEQTRDWPEEDRTLAFHALMAVTGIGQVDGDSALGLQAGSLSKLDPRTRRGRLHNVLISMSSSASLTGGFVTAHTVAQAANLSPAGQVAAYATGGLWAWANAKTQRLLIERNLSANTFGRGNINSEGDADFSALQKRILQSLERVGGAGVMNNVTLELVRSGGPHVLHLLPAVLDGVVWRTAAKAKDIEQSRQELTGASAPSTSAKATALLLVALGADTAAGIPAALSPAVGREWLTLVDNGLSLLEQGAETTENQFESWTDSAIRFLTQLGGR